MALSALRGEVAMLDDLAQQLAAEATEIHSVRSAAAPPPCSQPTPQPRPARFA